MEKTKLKLTKEQYDKLNNPELEWFLTTAYKSQFITGLTITQAKILFEIYNEVFHQKMKTTTCSQCRLEVCSKLGKLFFEYEAELNDDPIDDPNKEECDMTEEELEKYADEINEAIVKDINESHAQKTNDSKATKTNNTKKKEKK